jgi:hypothetical protein
MCAFHARGCGKKAIFFTLQGCQRVHVPPARALGQQHLDQVVGRAVAEQLALVLFMEGDAVRCTSAMKSAGV